MLWCLNNTLHKGDRRFGPSLEELKAVSSGSPIMLRASLLDGQVKAIHINSQSTVGEAVVELIHKCVTWQPLIRGHHQPMHKRPFKVVD